MPMPIDYEQLVIINELSEIIRLHNTCIERMRTYRKSYPFLVPPNVATMIEENLKENVQMLYNELNNVYKPRSEQRRYTCKRCHGVFAVSLPSGVCDECRSKVETQPVYGPRATASILRKQEENATRSDDEQPLAEPGQPEPDGPGIENA